MNREIKFRAWDNKNKKWLDQVPCDEYMLDSDCWDCPDQDDMEDMTFFYPNNPLGPAFGGRIIYQQFIGLKDKNKKEVYEGDILKCDMGRAGEQICKIEYAAPEFRFTLVSEEPSIPLDFTFNSVKSMEIIGNIFENTKL